MPELRPGYSISASANDTFYDITRRSIASQIVNNTIAGIIFSDPSHCCCAFCTGTLFPGSQPRSSDFDFSSASAAAFVVSVIASHAARLQNGKLAILLPRRYLRGHNTTNSHPGQSSFFTCGSHVTITTFTGSRPPLYTSLVMEAAYLDQESASSRKMSSRRT